MLLAMEVFGPMSRDYNRTDASPTAIADELLGTLRQPLNAHDPMAMMTYGSDLRTALRGTAGDPQDRI